MPVTGMSPEKELRENALPPGSYEWSHTTVCLSSAHIEGDTAISDTLEGLEADGWEIFDTDTFQTRAANGNFPFMLVVARRPKP